MVERNRRLTVGHVLSALTGPLVLTAVAGLLWRRGHRRLPEFMALVALVSAVVTIASVRARTAFARFDSFVRPRAAGMLAWCLLAPVFYLVVMPLGLVLRLFGRPALERRRDPGQASYWTERAGEGDGAAKRMYADERGWSPVGFSRRYRRRVVAGTVAAVVVCEIAALGALRWWNRPPARSAFTGVAFRGARYSASLRGLPWADAAFQETDAIASAIFDAPFVGSSVRDFSGEYVNVSGRVRRSYQTALAPPEGPIDVWFFGGSTMFGFDLQRDDYTIPSQIVRLAERAGIAVRARNYGAPGYVNFQEVVLLSMVVSGEPPPDLVVFYDGINDKSRAMLGALDGVQMRREPADLGFWVRRAAGASEHGADAAPRSRLRDPKEMLPVSMAGLAEDTVDVYRQGVDLSRALARHYGFRVVHFWQPDIYSKRALDPGELELLGPLGLDAFRLAGMRRFSTAVRRALPAGVVDLSGALDGTVGPVLSDLVHVNEAGGAAVAAEMFASLRADLEAIRRAKR